MGIRERIPRELRVELARLRRWPRLVIAGRRFATARGGADFEHVLATHASPLSRPGTTPDPRLQAGKETNVRVAASRLDGLLIDPGRVLSFHRMVGWPSTWRGFAIGLELHDGEMAEGIGGGACQVANLLYYLALCAGMTIVERHRHSLDLFPDSDRRVPFGCGATVFYNWADLRFANPLDTPVALRLGIADGQLVGELRAPADPGYRIEVYEVDHRFFERDGERFRENRIRRRITRGGPVLIDHEIAHNVCRVAYRIDALERAS